MLLGFTCTPLRVADEVIFRMDAAGAPQSGPVTTPSGNTPVQQTSTFTQPLYPINSVGSGQ